VRRYCNGNYFFIKFFIRKIAPNWRRFLNTNATSSHYVKCIVCFIQVLRDNVLAANRDPIFTWIHTKLHNIVSASGRRARVLHSGGRNFHRFSLSRMVKCVQRFNENHDSLLQKSCFDILI